MAKLTGDNCRCGASGANKFAVLRESGRKGFFEMTTM